MNASAISAPHAPLLLRGEVVVLLGPSGSGKSTLLNILGGLDAATAGSVRFVGGSGGGGGEGAAGGVTTGRSGP